MCHICGGEVALQGRKKEILLPLWMQIGWPIS